MDVILDEELRVTEGPYGTTFEKQVDAEESIHSRPSISTIEENCR